MYPQQSDASFSFYQPVLLPAALQGMQQALVRARGEAGSHKAAIAILKHYCNTYERSGIQQNLQLLLNGSFCNPQMTALADAAERQNIFLFYEFTMMMMDALYMMQGGEEQEQG